MASAWSKTIPLGLISLFTLASAPAIAQVLPLADVTAMALGGRHSCALTKTGAVKCWGSNEWGQLGDGGSTGGAVPRDVLGIDGGVVSLAAGYAHTCAVTTARTIQCWGHNYYGTLGDGSVVNSARPVTVKNVDDAVAVLAGGSTSCALRANGTVMCWGWNASGSLGIGRIDYDAHPLPEPVLGLPQPVLSLAKGDSHTCALDATGAVYCWGWNWYGQLGDGSTENRAMAVRMKDAPASVTSVSVGKNHTCVIAGTGGVHCWGDGSQRGDAGSTQGFGPVVPFVLGNGIVKVAANYLHTCALHQSGSLMCWGANDVGQLGDGSVTTRGQPVQSIASADVRDVFAGYHHTCAILADASVNCWGDNNSDQLGNRTMTLRASHYPKAVPGLETGVEVVAAGRNHACAVAEARAYCWGYNDYGQLGGRAGEHQSLPVKVALDEAAVSVATGVYHSCAVTLSGGIACWGRNLVGELGDGSTQARDGPVAVSNLSGRVLSLDLGGSHACAVVVDGAVQCWGFNGFGAVGDGTGVNRSSPTTVEALGRNVRWISAGSGHTCAIASEGAVKCWGSNAAGQLGNGNQSDQLAPAVVSGLSRGMVQVAAGDSHTCALDDQGDVWCWGANQAGQLGTGGGEALYPTRVEGLGEKAKSLGSGATHTCAVLLSGDTRCWGAYGGAQVGARGISSPVAVPGLPRVRTISAGGAHTCAIDQTGALLCWGLNPWGELGRGVFGYRPSAENVALAVPVPVIEYHNSPLGHYFISAGEGEFASIEAGAAGPGWRATGLGFKAYLPETGIAPNARPVCRFYGTPGVGPNSHFYSADAAECEAVISDPGWSYEGIAFHIAAPIDHQCLPSAQPVYRSYNQRFAQNDSNHRYTTDSAVYAQMLGQGWVGEGPRFCAPR